MSDVILCRDVWQQSKDCNCRFSHDSSAMIQPRETHLCVAHFSLTGPAYSVCRIDARFSHSSLHDDQRDDKAQVASCVSASCRGADMSNKVVSTPSRHQHVSPGPQGYRGSSCNSSQHLEHDHVRLNARTTTVVLELGAKDLDLSVLGQ